MTRRHPPEEYQDPGELFKDEPPPEKPAPAPAPVPSVPKT